MLMPFKKIVASSPVVHLILLSLLAGSLLCYHLGNRPLAGSEGRWGEIAREMLLTRDWIVPKINGIPYRDKPVASYWLIDLASLPAHRVTEATTRLPSALSIVLSVLFLYGIARHFWGEKAAFLTALIFLTTYPVIYWGRKANADTLTILGNLICIWIFLKGEGEPVENVKWVYPFFIVAGLTSLMKGLLGFVLPSLIVFPYLFAKYRLRVFRKRFLLHVFIALLLGIFLFLIPFLLDVYRSHTESSLYLVYRENIVRFFHPFDHKAPFFYYFYYIFITVAPWSLFIPFLIVSLRRRGSSRDEGTLFFGIWFVLLFIFFTLSGSKRGYYLMPVIPAYSALLTAAFFRGEASESPRKLASFLARIPPILVLVGGVMVALAPLWAGGGHIPGSFLTVMKPLTVPAGLMMIAAGGVSFLCMKKRRIGRGIFALVAGYFALFSLLFWFLYPAIARQDPFLPFCNEVKKVAKGRPLGDYGLASRSTLYFYLGGTPLPHQTSPAVAESFLKMHPDACLIIRKKDLSKFKQMEPLKILVAEKGKAKGKGYLLVSLNERCPEKVDTGRIDRKEKGKQSP